LINWNKWENSNKKLCTKDAKINSMSGKKSGLPKIEYYSINNARKITYS